MKIRPVCEKCAVVQASEKIVTEVVAVESSVKPGERRTTIGGVFLCSTCAGMLRADILSLFPRDDY